MDFITIPCVSWHVWRHNPTRNHWPGIIEMTLICIHMWESDGHWWKPQTLLMEQFASPTPGSKRQQIRAQLFTRLPDSSPGSNRLLRRRHRSLAIASKSIICSRQHGHIDLPKLARQNVPASSGRANCNLSCTMALQLSFGEMGNPSVNRKDSNYHSSKVDQGSGNDLVIAESYVMHWKSTLARVRSVSETLLIILHGILLGEAWFLLLYPLCVSRTTVCSVWGLSIIYNKQPFRKQ